jgi:MFS family permease
VLLTKEYGLKTAAEFSGYLYAWKNACGAAAAFPAGWLGDRSGHRLTLAAGYLIGVLTMAGFAALFLTDTASLPWLVVLFAAAGVYLAVEEALEPALAADLVPDPAVRGTAFGVLATVNGVGDFAASLLCRLAGAVHPRRGKESMMPHGSQNLSGETKAMEHGRHGCHG